MKDLLPILIPAILSSGFLGGIYLLFKLKPEVNQITVTAAQGVVLMQTGVIEDLRKENRDFREELRKMEERFDEQELRFGQKLREMHEENDLLRKRIRELERIAQ